MTVSVEDPDVIRMRAEARAAAMSAPLTRSTRLSAIVLGVAAGIGTGIGVATGDARVTAAVVAVLASAGLLAAWSWLFRGDAREALELIWDHSCHEMAEWKQETGTVYPRTVAAARAWLLAYPESRGRASILLRLGRLAEADAAIEASRPTSPEEAFGLGILRRTRDLLSGVRPDLRELHATWRAIPDIRERRHRRECLALLDANVAQVDGGDPWAVLADARTEVGDVHPSMQVSRLVIRYALEVLVAIVLAAFTTGVLVTAGI